MPPKIEPLVRPLPAIDLEQPQATSFLASLRREGLPSLLFVGPEGSGKELTAIDFARGLCCEKPKPCRLDGELCDSCLKASHLDHPGIHLIHPTPTQGSGEDVDGDVSDISKVLEEKRRDIFSRYRFAKKASIRVARARAVIQRANTRPFDSPLNIFIFVDAHAMREEAQNALLKVVEEPPPHAATIFVTTNPEGILATIRSRCQRVRFLPLKARVIERVLSEYYDISTDEARRAARLAQGSIDRARNLAEAADDSERAAAVAFVEGITRGPESWAIGQASVVGRGSNRDAVARFLDEVAVVFRDTMTGDRDLYVNVNSADVIDGLAEKWEQRSIPAVIERIFRARGDILLANSNVDSTLAELFLGLKRMQ